MRTPLRSRRCWLAAWAVLTGAAGVLLAASWSSAGQTLVPKPAGKILYILPSWPQYFRVDETVFADEVRQLRTRIGEGRFVRVGFTVYIRIAMNDWRVDLAEPSALRRELEPTIAALDLAVARARRENVPICLSFVTANRGKYDPVQRDSEREDRRNMQWYSDNELARGWWSHSRYARKQRLVLEAYVRELGRIVANRMARYPGIVVAASGDGEVELSFDRSALIAQASGERPAVLADYSPFTVAEFRDWLRHGGWYGDGQPFAGQGYPQGIRYEGDASPGDDTNRDGHTLNGDFGTSFTSWSLRYFDWSLADDVMVDAHAIPASTYESNSWNARPDGGETRFDAPRVTQPGNSWWALWDRFRQTMVWRHNVEFARWMTTSPDPETGLTIPAERWYSDQIPADYLFGGTPETPNERLETSASPWWTADVSPYGALGITSFNVILDGVLYPTLRNLAPVVAARDVRWGILEYHPSVPTSNSLDVYLEDMAVIEQYRPSLIVPIYWGDPYLQIQNTGFEIALKRLVDQIKDGPAATSTLLSRTEPGWLAPSAPAPFLAPLDLWTQLTWLRNRQTPLPMPR